MILTSKILTNVAFLLSALIIYISIIMCACFQFANPHHILCDDIFPYFNCCSYEVISCLSRELKVCWKSVASRTFAVEFAVRSWLASYVAVKRGWPCCNVNFITMFSVYIIKIYSKLKYLGKDIMASSLLAENCLIIQDQYALLHEP